MSIWYDEGKYMAKIESAGLTESRNGNPQVQLALQLISFLDPDQDDWIDPKEGDYPPLVYLTITDKTMGTEDKPGWVRKTLDFLGFTNFENLEVLEGVECQVRCSHRESLNGNEFEQWDIVRSGESKVEKPEAKKLRELDAKFGAKPKAKPKNGKKKTEAKGKAKVPTPDEPAGSPDEKPMPF